MPECRRAFPILSIVWRKFRVLHKRGQVSQIGCPVACSASHAVVVSAVKVSVHVVKVFIFGPMRPQRDLTVLACHITYSVPPFTPVTITDMQIEFCEAYHYL